MGGDEAVSTTAVLGGSGLVGRSLVACAPGSVLPMSRRLGWDLETMSAEGLAQIWERHEVSTVVDVTGSSWGLTQDAIARRCRRITGVVIEAARLAATRPRIVTVGSVMEYASGAEGVPVTARTALRPETVYGEVKLECARRVQDAGGSVVRLPNVIGPGGPSTSLLGQVTGALKAREDMIVLQPLTAVRDYLDARDAAVGIWRAVDLPDPCEVVLGTGVPTPVRALVQRVVNLSGVPLAVVEKPSGSGWRRTMQWTVVDPTDAQGVLGWAPQHTLDSSILALVRSDVWSAD
ncbi:NAD-dependent epimerase/dehydratase family protein [Enemella evansiae]|uniref:NAD-dependent epimerase/dehydratase family protein n=1 Tax=Enemella evansiae TaxID=2016499 RepID=UPI002B4C0C5F|nr:NAD(P)-dependent oxidoreductase [Enemella evansiae]